MAKKATIYSIFIASPSDVDDERNRFVEVIYSFNERYAIKNGAVFIPVYWEQNTGGMNPPQDKANNRLDYCDFAIVSFGKKWGTTPWHKKEKNFTSGTEEEFNRAVKNYNDPEKEMKDVVVLLKEFSSNEMDDPGYNTKKIIRFKKHLQKKGYSYLPYVNVNDFASILANHLNEWLDNHIRGGWKIVKPVSFEYDYFKFKHIEHIRFVGEEILKEDNKTYKKLKKASKLSDSNEVVKAQEVYEELIREDRCLPVINDYAKLLYRIGELSYAEQLFKEIYKTAQIEDSHGWMARATANLAIICISRSEHDKAVSLLQESLGYNKSLEHSAGVADNYRHLANVYRLQGDVDMAEENIVRAINIFGDNNIYSGLADSLADHGILQRIKGEYDSCIALYNKALKINLKYTPEKESCKADYMDRLGTIYRIRGNFLIAGDYYQQALDINEKLCRSRGEAQVLGHLGLLEFYYGRYEEALEFIDKAIRIDRELNNREGIAKHLASKARVYLWIGELERAQDLSRQSREINTAIDSTEGIAYSTYMLASAQYGTDEILNAEKNIEKAIMLWHRLKCKEGIAECYDLKARILLRKSLYPASIDLVDDALEICNQSGSRIMESSLLITRAMIKARMAGGSEIDDLQKALSITIDTNENAKRRVIEEYINRQVEISETKIEKNDRED